MATTFFLSIVPVQPPSEVLGLDQNDRVRFSFNVQAYSTSLPDLPGCVASLIQSHAPSLGTLNTNLFIGSIVSIPTGDGPFILIRSTGGGPPLLSHQSLTGSSITAHFTTAQIVVTAADYVTAQNLANDVYLVCYASNVNITAV